MKLIEMNMDKLIELCKKFHVAKLWVFGSILTSRFNDESDVDFSVNFKKDDIQLEDYADNYFDFLESLENLFRRKVDLVCNDSVKNRVFKKNLDCSKVLIYG